MSGRGKADKVKGKAVSFQPCQNSVSSTARIHRILRKGNYAECVGAGSPAYLAAVMEYLVAEVLKLPRNAARGQEDQNHPKTSKDDDEELKLSRAESYDSAGRCIAQLLPKKTEKKA